MVPDDDDEPGSLASLRARLTTGFLAACFLTAGLVAARGLAVAAVDRFAGALRVALVALPLAVLRVVAGVRLAAGLAVGFAADFAADFLAAGFTAALVAGFAFAVLAVDFRPASVLTPEALAPEAFFAAVLAAGLVADLAAGLAAVFFAIGFAADFAVAFAAGFTVGFLATVFGVAIFAGTALALPGFALGFGLAAVLLVARMARACARVSVSVVTRILLRSRVSKGHNQSGEQARQKAAMDRWNVASQRRSAKPYRT